MTPMMILRSIRARSLRRLLNPRLIDLKLLLPRLIRRLQLKRLLPLLASLPKVTVHSKKTWTVNKRETIEVAEEAPIEVAAEEEAANGVMPLDKLVAAEEEANSIRDLVLPIKLMPRVTKLSRLIREHLEVKEETEVVMALSMRASTREMVLAEAREEEERMVETDLPRTTMPKKRLRKRPRNQPLRRRRSLNLNMKKLFLVKISMITLVLSRLLVVKRMPDRSPKLMSHIKLTLKRRYTNPLFSKMLT